MPLRCAVILVCAMLLIGAPFAPACLWDTDTLRDEQRGIPTVASVLAGKWEKHSDFYYENRIKVSRAALSKDPNDLPAMDDLAVALEKLGRFDEAIEIMRAKLAKDPDSYTAHANLGTFYFHRGSEGDFDRGVEHIERALQINPDAHFGRERYQLQIVKYIRDAKADPTVLDRGSFVIPILYPESNTIRYDRSNTRPTSDPKIDAAIEGIVGIIRFGTGRGSHLFYALGDLLAVRGDKHLAYRAYRRALEYDHPRPDEVREAMKQVSGAHEDQRNFAEEVIAAEEADAAQWVKSYQEFEDGLIRAGTSTTDDAAFAPFYRKHGNPRDKPSVASARFEKVRSFMVTYPWAMWLAIGLVGYAVLRAATRRRRKKSATAAAAAQASA